MPNRARNYMDRLLGRNEGNEGRDFTDGRRYGDEQRFYDEPFNDSGSEWDRNSEMRDTRSDVRNTRDMGWDGRDREYQGRHHRSQASRTRPRPTQYKNDHERDYNMRHYTGDYMDTNPNGTTRGFDYNLESNEKRNQNSFWDDNFRSERNRNDSFYAGDFRNTEREQPRGKFFGKGPKGWKRSDERVKEDVSEALYRDYHIDASDIEVDVKDGVVTLSGFVDSRESKRAAEECIENLSGVVDVHNRIRIQDSSNVSNLRNGGDTDEKRSLS